VAFGVGGLLVAAVVLGATEVSRTAEEPARALPDWAQEARGNVFSDAVRMAYEARRAAHMVVYTQTPAGFQARGNYNARFNDALQSLAEEEFIGATVLPEPAILAMHKLMVGSVREVNRGRPVDGAPEDWNRAEPGKLADDGLGELVDQARQSLGLGELSNETMSMILSRSGEPGGWAYLDVAR
jgi:hypothetical protein